MFRFLCVLFFAGIVVSAQTPVVLKNTFQINTDVQGAPIQQSSPRLFYYKDSAFLVSWQDMRYGIPSYFYRKFNGTSTPVTEPAQFSGSNSVYFINQNDFIATEDRVTPHFFDDYFYSVHAKKYVAGTAIGEGTTLGGYPGLWCGTGWMGFNVSLITNANSIQSFVSNNGNIYRTVYDSALQMVVQDEQSTIQHSVYVKAQQTQSGKTGMFWVNLPWAAWGNEPAKIYGRFYDNTDQIINDSVLLITLPPSYPMTSGGELPLFAEPSGVDGYNVMYILDKKLYYTKINHGGTIHQPQDSITLVALPGMEQYYVNGYTVTNPVDSIYDIVVKYSYPVSANFVYVILPVHLNGTIYSPAVYQMYENYLIHTGLFKFGVNKYYIADAAGGDVYLKTLANFATLAARKICDDPDISNENNSYLVPLSDGNFISGYSNEAGKFARTVSSGTAPSGEQKQMDAAPLGVMADGTIFSLQSYSDGSGYIHKVHKYSSTLEPLSVTTIKTAGNEDYISSGPLTFSRRSDGTFRFLTVKGNDLIGGTLSSEFAVLSEKVLYSNTSIYGYSISRENDNSFLVQYNSGAGFYDADFTPASQYRTDTYGTYVGDDVVVSLYNTYPTPLAFANMKIKHVRTGEEKIVQVGYPQQMFKVFAVDNSRFLLTYLSTPEKIACRPYTFAGNPIRNAVEVTTAVNPANIMAAVRGDILFFSWTSRENGNFDIYGKAYLLNSVTNIGDETETPLTFGLLQNYPNPFNPSTEIRFSIPDDREVSLVIYDALGRETAVLINERMRAGVHSAAFNGNGLASGIYYYRLSAGGNTATAKMLLLK